MDELNIRIKELEAVFLTVWCRESSAYPDGWSAENPAYGQWPSTSRIAKRILGGEILFAMTSLGPHFWNLLPDGNEWDFTRSQLPEGFILPKGAPEPDESLDIFVDFFPEVKKRQTLLERNFFSLAFTKSHFTATITIPESRLAG